MPLNYTFTTETITTPPNSTWGEVDLDGDGVGDGGGIPIKVTLTPTNTATHTISAWDFTISSSTHQYGPGGTIDEYADPQGFEYEGWNDTTNTTSIPPSIRIWNDQCSCFDATIVKGVRAYNTAQPNTVGNQAVFMVYLHSNAQIQTSDINVLLDLDGDAQPISSNNTDVSETEFRPWTLALKLDGSSSVTSANYQNSNCIVVSHTDTFPTNQYNHWNINGDTPGEELSTWQNEDGVIAGDVARVRFTTHTNSDGENQVFENSTVFDAFPAAGNMTYMAPLFYILPKPGYAISRSMLSISSSHYANISTSPFYAPFTVTWNDQVYSLGDNDNLKNTTDSVLKLSSAFLFEVNNSNAYPWLGDELDCGMHYFNEASDSANNIDSEVVSVPSFTVINLSDMGSGYWYGDDYTGNFSELNLEPEWTSGDTNNDGFIEGVMPLWPATAYTHIRADICNGSSIGTVIGGVGGDNPNLIIGPGGDWISGRLSEYANLECAPGDLSLGSNATPVVPSFDLYRGYENNADQDTDGDGMGNGVEVLLVDMNPNWPFSEPGYNMGLSNGIVTLPDNYCANDFANNAVAVMFPGLRNYQPGSNSPDIMVRIKGHAVEIDPDCESLEFNINIEDG